MTDDDVNLHYLFAWLRECPQFHSHVVQQTLPDQEEPQYLLSPDAFYYHGRWLYEHGQITAEDLQNAVHWLDAHDNAPPCEEEI
jgi:TPR repeat protein